ncbi:MAG: hypothetical protein K0S11_1353 [Gammaproteobacteria bacterium]|jgi:prepilin-type N-terminal cleavage/methylation domain-containing protein|nr:hypothetical protein [Gammaproteobacteria bacterium]
MQQKGLIINGFSLIELLLSLAIFSFALLGLTQLSVKAMLMNHSAYLYNLANQQAFAAAELIRTQCAVEGLQQEIAKNLPVGKLQISKQGRLNFITISWYDKYHEQQGQPALNTVKLTVYEIYP